MIWNWRASDREVGEWAQFFDQRQSMLRVGAGPTTGLPTLLGGPGGPSELRKSAANPPWQRSSAGPGPPGPRAGPTTLERSATTRARRGAEVRPNAVRPRVWDHESDRSDLGFPLSRIGSRVGCCHVVRHLFGSVRLPLRRRLTVRMVLVDDNEVGRIGRASLLVAAGHQVRPVDWAQVDPEVLTDPSVELVLAVVRPDGMNWDRYHRLRPIGVVASSGRRPRTVAIVAPRGMANPTLALRLAALGIDEMVSRRHASTGTDLGALVSGEGCGRPTQLGRRNWSASVSDGVATRSGWWPRCRN